MVDAALQPTQISVHAKFHNANGFFGLTSYLAYAQKQITYSRDCVEKANLGIRNKLMFPWSSIDDSEVEAVGFIPHPFEFTIDQARILDLLTGHTLYNESTVAIRELVQNSLDAIRVFKFDRNRIGLDHEGSIKIEWDADDLEFSILDNGTGMTQDIIERHLLNVGSSRYQDPAFREEYKDFSPISRFGIGVLSTFMVADDVQIVTFHENEREGREISLRSVHGKYLIRLLDKNESAEAKEIGSHGTKITMKFRSSAKRFNVVRTLQRWIVFPDCSVTVSVGGNSPVKIGFESPRDALKAYVDNNPDFGTTGSNINYHQHEIDGVTIAYAMTYSRHFRDSSFLEYSDAMKRSREISPVGICIEGVRVEFDPPGFSGGRGLLSLANCKGISAPKTNVARTSLESANEKDRITKLSLDIYMKQVNDEIDRMQSKEGYSLSYAIEQFPFIAGQVFSSSGFSDDELRFTAAWNFPMFVLETESRREAVSGNYLRSIGGFWSIESQSMSSLIALLRDSPPNVTCRQISTASQLRGDPLPSGSFIVNSYLGTVATQVIKAKFEIKKLRGSVIDRRLDVRWEPIGKEPSWIGTDALEAMTVDLERSRSEQTRKYSVERRHRGRTTTTFLPIRALQTFGLDDYFAISLHGEAFVLYDTPICQFLLSLDIQNADHRLQTLVYLDAMLSSPARRVFSVDIEFAMKEISARYETENWNISDFLQAVRQTETRLQVFNPWSWQREENPKSGAEWDDLPF